MILWLKLLHILAAMLWLGGGLMLFFVGQRARATNDPAKLRDFAGSLAYLGPRVLAPAVLVLPVTGIWMVLDNAGFNFELTWVRIGLGLFVLAFLVGAVYLSQLGVRMARREGSDLRALVDQWLIGYGAVLVILLFALWDMVFKPVA